MRRHSQLWAATFFCRLAPRPVTFLSLSLARYSNLLPALLFSRSVCSRRKYDADGVEKEVIADMIHVQHRALRFRSRLHLRILSVLLKSVYAL
jgi:hypothetical protein